MSRSSDGCAASVCKHSLGMWGLSVTGVSGHELDDQNEVAVSHGEERMRCREAMGVQREALH